ncbi:MAG TPA: hypothetical protein VNU46_04785 [Gemmatimonadaceae bacterium]|jgi:hypothetical protein|nr:hypothetical protein [Gemmatimonadaceae bacterium]
MMRPTLITSIPFLSMSLSLRFSLGALLRQRCAKLQRAGLMGGLVATATVLPFGAPAPAVPPMAPVAVSQADDVTVVPFTLDGLPSVSEPLFPATIDGHYGLFGLDVGSVEGFVNRVYLKPNATGGGLDTVAVGDVLPTQGASMSTTMRLGTLEWPIRTAVQISQAGARDLHQLGNIGIGELTPFETIIDYTHTRLVLIRLDRVGHRLAVVPGYTPVDSIPLIFVDNGHVAVVGRIGDMVDTLALDTGNPLPVILTSATRQRVQAHLAGGFVLDSLVIGKRTFAKLVGPPPFNQLFVGPTMPYMPDIIGYPVISQFGAVGINQRTRQLILYR